MWASEATVVLRIDTEVILWLWTIELGLRTNCMRKTLSLITIDNRPFPSYPLPLFQNESRCETIHMKMSFTFTSIFMQIKVIFISMVSHVDSFWNWGKWQLGNGLFRMLQLTNTEIMACFTQGDANTRESLEEFKRFSKLPRLFATFFLTTPLKCRVARRARVQYLNFVINQGIIRNEQNVSFLIRYMSFFLLSWVLYYIAPLTFAYIFSSPLLRRNPSDGASQFCET